MLLLTRWAYWLIKVLLLWARHLFAPHCLSATLMPVKSEANQPLGFWPSGNIAHLESPVREIPHLWECTVGAALRGRPAQNSVSVRGVLTRSRQQRRAATEGRPYSTFQ